MSIRANYFLCSSTFLTCLYHCNSARTRTDIWSPKYPRSLSSQPRSFLVLYLLPPMETPRVPFPFYQSPFKRTSFCKFPSTLLSSTCHVLTSIWLCLGIPYKLVLKQFPDYCTTTDLSIPLRWLCQQVTGSTWTCAVVYVHIKTQTRLLYQLMHIK